MLNDHGIGAHFAFIEKYFPDSRVIPILLQPRSDANLENLQDTIMNISKQNNLLVIWSIDRSHYVPEPWALLHDTTTWSVFSEQNSLWKNYKKLDIDCPSCAWLIRQLWQAKNSYPLLIRRDSSAQLLHTTGANNTSRWIVHYANETKWIPDLQTWITLLFLNPLDSIGLPDPLKKSAFAHWHQEYNTKFPAQGYYHRLWTSIDEIFLPIFYPIDSLKDRPALQWWKDLGVNHIFSFSGSSSTITWSVQPYVEIHKYWLSAYIFTLTLDQSVHSDRLCDDIQNISSWSSILMIQRQHSESTLQKRQIQTAEHLIECGIDAIIWYDKQLWYTEHEYKGKPIVFSVWWNSIYLSGQWSPVSQFGIWLIVWNNNITLLTWQV